MNFIPFATIPDVSFYQDLNSTPQRINFTQMRTQCEGVIIRAGQNTWIDEDVVHNWQAAKEAGLKRGSYWFFDSRSSPEAQADLWKAAISSDVPEWGLWCDLEESYGGLYKGETNWKRFAEAVMSRFPNVRVGIYSANWWWSAQAVQQADYWQSFPLWVAGYSSVETVILPAPWRIKGAVLWQFTSKGNGALYGAESSSIDLNYTSQDFYDLFEAVIPPPGGDMEKWRMIYAGGLKVRNFPLTGTQVQSLMPGDIIEGIFDTNTSWINISTITRTNGVILAPITGQWWCSGLPTYVEKILPPPPPPPPAGHTVQVIVDGTEIAKVELS